MSKALLIVKNLEKIIDRASSIAFKAGYICCSNEQPYTAKTIPHRDVVAYTNDDFIKEAIAELEEAMKTKTCKFCAYCEPFNSICFNDKSPLCADSVNSEYGCIYWEEKTIP